jgi:hypothetical protein
VRRYDASAFQSGVRREQEAGGRRGVVERLFAHAIARQHETATAHVPHRDAEHAVERVCERRPALLVEMRHDLGVGAGPEVMAARDQVATERRVVVDLAVAHDHDVAALVGERLRAARDVDDGESSATERRTVEQCGTIAVGTAVHERRRHRRRQRSHAAVVAADPAVDAAHRRLSSRRGGGGSCRPRTRGRVDAGSAS